MRVKEEMVKLVKEADATGPVTVTICHAAQLLIRARW